MSLGLRTGLGVGAGGLIAAAWGPAKIGAPLVQWNAPDSMTVTSGHVPSWADKSGSGVTLAEATHPPTADVAALNGYTVATFDGIAQALGAAARQFTAAFTIAAVLRPRAAGANPMVTEGNAATGVELLESTARRVQLNGVTDCDGSALVQGWEVWIARLSASHTIKLAVNGADDPLTNQTSSIAAPAAGSRLALGARWDGSAYSVFGPCSIAELLICNAALDDATTALLTTYLRSKYGL